MHDSYETHLMVVYCRNTNCIFWEKIEDTKHKYIEYIPVCSVSAIPKVHGMVQNKTIHCIQQLMVCLTLETSPLAKKPGCK